MSMRQGPVTVNSRGRFSVRVAPGLAYRGGCAVVLATHELDEAERLADVVIELEDRAAEKEEPETPKEPAVVGSQAQEKKKPGRKKKEEVKG